MIGAGSWRAVKKQVIRLFASCLHDRKENGEQSLRYRKAQNFIYCQAFEEIDRMY